MKVRPMTIKELHEETGESEQRLRVRIQNNLVPYGNAIKLPKSKKYSYYIDTVKYFQERNQTIPEKYIIERTSEELGVITDPSRVNEFIKNWRNEK